MVLLANPVPEGRPADPVVANADPAAVPAATPPEASPAKPITQATDPKVSTAKTVPYDPEIYGVADPKTGRPEKVPSKFWDYENKRVRMGDWLAQYEYAEKRLGKKFEKPPEEYELKSDQEVQFPAELVQDPVYKAMASWAKDEGELSQSQFASMMRRFVVAQTSTLQEVQQQQLKAMGPEGPARIERMRDWLASHLSTEEFQQAQGMVQSVEQLTVMEKLLEKALPAKLEKGENYEVGDTLEILNELQYAKDQYGNRKMAVDPQYADMVRKRRAAYFSRQQR